MSTQPSQTQGTLSSDEAAVRALYQHMLDGWNQRNADAMATLCTEDGEMIGFDGSQLIGRPEITSTLHDIFANHPTPPYLSIVRNVRFLDANVAILRAIVGMVPPGQSDIEPALNSVQTLVAARHDGTWHIALFQNTPAQLHGRPEEVQKMAKELRQLLT